MNRTADKPDKYFQVLEEIGQEIPRDTFDPQAVVDKVGNDPEALLRWVTDNTYLVPYQGVLRGPIGVLMKRQRNSQGRALLLHEILRLAGHETRRAPGNLSQAVAQDILQKARLAPVQEIIPPEGYLARMRAGYPEIFSKISA